ncbi:hypothetical protein MNBD_GAMMA24-1753 [hydrothermal vent metagenome]|uniref:DUF202 domain-containing protein n=1 Tax=hydrothermal vent metagenome TaxID=652676 RepID=A0A3B1BKV2_9ZZZZ
MPDTNSLALDRTVLANERTYAAWIRTGLAALATGLGIAKFMSGSMPYWSIHIIASILIIFSAVAFFLAAWRYQHLHVGMAHLDVKMISMTMVKLSSFVLIVCSFIALIGLWYIIPSS